MGKYQLNDLEDAVIRRNPLLADRLKPGLAEKEIRTTLKRAKVVTNLEPILALYTWRNGTMFDHALMAGKSGFFPCAIYQYIDLEKAIIDKQAYEESMCASFPSLANSAGRYLPLFWNGATTWIALDLASSVGRVVIMRYFAREASLRDGQYEPEIHETDPPREAYSSFEDFVIDAIRANRENTPLSCLRT